jgi:uncharacterized protein (TIGR00725 family)
MRIGVIGPGTPDAGSGDEQLAERVGELLARRGATLVCGGLGGVMAAACRGAQRAGGTTVGLLPGLDTDGANPYLTVALPTGLGELRNGLVVNASEAVICVGGSWGTLSEMALALRTGTPCVGLACWAVDTLGSEQERTVHRAESPEDAVDAARTAASAAR